MDQQGELSSMRTLARADSPLFLGDSSGPRSPRANPVLSVRAVDFIAKPGMSSQLRAAVDRFLLKFLARQFGFAGTILLTTHGEPRRIAVLSFWRTDEYGCSANRWELARDVQQMLRPLIDAISRVRTFQADVSEFLHGQWSLGLDAAESSAADTRLASTGQGQEL